MRKESTELDIPITQLLVTVQFQPVLAGLTILQLAEFYDAFKARYPLFQQVDRAGPMPHQIGVQTVEIPMPGMPRLQFVSSDITRHILFQEDRISVGWTRTAPLDKDPEYPGFDAVADELVSAFQRVRDFATQIGVASPTAATLEIVYNDAYIVGTVEKGQTRRLSHVFRFLNPDFRIPAVGFEWSWVTSLDDQDGYVQVVANGVDQAPDGSNIVRLETTARCGVSAEEQSEGVLPPLRAMRERIREVYMSVVIPHGVAKS